MNKFLSKIFATDSSIAPVITRITLGALLLPHGLQKTLGWFGGYGFSGTMQYFTETAGLPWIVAFLVILGESLGALSLLAGFAVRFCAASLIVIMVGAIIMAHLQHGFFINWTGQQAGEGIEYHLMVIGVSLSLLIAGAGRWSVDRALQQN